MMELERLDMMELERLDMMELERLLERYLEIVESGENKENAKYWDNANEWHLIERWRGRPAVSRNTPFTMALDIGGYAQVLDINMHKYYNDPETALAEQLRYSIWEHDNLKGHRYFEKAVFIPVGCTLDAPIFGIPVLYPEREAPWYDERNNVIKSRDDLLRIPPFDFNKSGRLPHITRTYEKMLELVGGKGIKVMFPVMSGAPFELAVMMRGFENILVDMYEDPEFFNEILATVVKYQKEFFLARMKYLGEDSLPKSYLGNDSVATPTLSPKSYTELILPHETELAKFHGGVRYWHSCGNTTAFYESIATIPGLKLMHIGPWSDVKKAVEVFGPLDIAIEICVNSVRDMYEKTEAEMRAQLEGIKAACDGRIRYQVRCDGIAVLDTVEGCLEKVAEWGRAAGHVFPG